MIIWNYMAYFVEIIARLRNDIEFHLRLEMKKTSFVFLQIPWDAL